MKRLNYITIVSYLSSKIYLVKNDQRKIAEIEIRS